jgi:hypothetical protein
MTINDLFFKLSAWVVAITCFVVMSIGWAFGRLVDGCRRVDAWCSRFIAWSDK